MCWIGLLPPFYNVKCRAQPRVFSSFWSFLKTFTVPVTFFPVTSPVNKAFAYRALVFRARYAICRYMFTVEFQYYFRQITASLKRVRKTCAKRAQNVRTLTKVIKVGTVFNNWSRGEQWILFPYNPIHFPKIYHCAFCYLWVKQTSQDFKYCFHFT